MGAGSADQTSVQSCSNSTTVHGAVYVSSRHGLPSLAALKLSTCQCTNHKLVRLASQTLSWPGKSVADSRLPQMLQPYSQQRVARGSAGGMESGSKKCGCSHWRRAGRRPPAARTPPSAAASGRRRPGPWTGPRSRRRAASRPAAPPPATPGACIGMFCVRQIAVLAALS